VYLKVFVRSNNKLLTEEQMGKSQADANLRQWLQLALSVVQTLRADVMGMFAK